MSESIWISRDINAGSFLRIWKAKPMCTPDRMYYYADDGEPQSDALNIEALRHLRPDLDVGPGECIEVPEELPEYVPAKRYIDLCDKKLTTRIAELEAENERLRDACRSVVNSQISRNLEYSTAEIPFAALFRVMDALKVRHPEETAR